MIFEEIQKLENEIAVNCRTEEKAKQLFDFLISLGFSWSGGDELDEDDTKWPQYDIGTTYFFYMHNKRLSYGNHSCIYGSRVEVFESPEDFINWYSSITCEPISLDIGDVL